MYKQNDDPPGWQKKNTQKLNIKMYYAPIELPKNLALEMATAVAVVVVTKAAST